MKAGITAGLLCIFDQYDSSCQTMSNFSIISNGPETATRISTDCQNIISFYRIGPLLPVSKGSNNCCVSCCRHSLVQFTVCMTLSVVMIGGEINRKSVPYVSSFTTADHPTTN